MEQHNNILDHLGVIVRWRRMILLSVFSVSLVTAGISLVLPVAYRARAVVYPPRKSQDMLGLSALLGGNLPMGLLGMGEGPVSATDFVPVLQSEHVAEAVANRFNLARRSSPGSSSSLSPTKTRLPNSLPRSPARLWKNSNARSRSAPEKRLGGPGTTGRHASSRLKRR